MTQETLQRLLEERHELSNKIHKISNFMLTDDFRNLGDADRKLLVAQKYAMEGYYKILCLRCDKYA